MEYVLRLSCLFLLVQFTIAKAGEDGGFPGVRGLMNDEEYRAAGLEKLSDEELEALDQWLIEYTAWEAPQMRKQAEEVRALEEETGFTARVRPPFEGWSGKTRFYLDNGQVWEQRLSGRFFYRGDDTEVSIRRNAMGFYVLEHTASGRAVGVKRVD